MAEQPGSVPREEVPREVYPRLIQTTMRRQAALSLRVAVIFLLMLFLLPVFNRFFPGVAGLKVGGFTLSWLFLAILFYPVTWVLSWYFIRASDAIEQECCDWKTVTGYRSTKRDSDEEVAR